MKKIFYTLLLTFISLSACTDDESTLATNEVGSISIEGLESSYTVRSYVGVNLKDIVSPTIQSDYSEDQLTYSWYLFNNEEDDADYTEFLISNEKLPDYEVNLPSGNYTLALKVQSQTNDNAQFATTTLSTSTQFSQGYYILKETADGNTDLDCYNQELQSDIISGGTGAPMQGKPYNISILYNGEYVNPDNNEMAFDNFIHVTTESHAYKGFRSEDMKEIFNNDNLFYSGPMEADEMPCSLFTTIFYNCYMSNTGIRSYMASSGTANSTGRLGFPTCSGGSKFVQIADYMTGIVYWSDTEHCLMGADFNASASSAMTTASGDNIQNNYPKDLNCLASGFNVSGGNTLTWFLCEQPSTGQRYLYKTDATGYCINEIIKLDPSLHLARSIAQGGNGLTASYIYCIDDNKLHAYSLQTGNELENINLPGIPANENITFVTNQYLNLGGFIESAYNRDDLIIGTQTGNNYKLYVYESAQMNGGQPIAEPAVIIEGTGTVKAVRYISPQKDITGNNISIGSMFGYTNPFPLSD